jgi:serine/threonine protein kinase/WD40 repeat protein
MPAPATIDDFLDLVRKSNQVDTSRLDAYLAQRRQDDTLPPDPTKFAALLVREGLLTNFQAEQLLQGRYKGFNLGGYRIIERLGAGGTGTVYLAEHEVMKRRVALKVVPPAVAADPGVLERFRREAQAAAVLDHPNIVRAYDFRQEGQLHVLVMEYVNGPSLEQVLQSGGPMSVPVACEYVRQAAVGLDHAHAQGLVHRDIKPGNLLVDPTGVVKILDMGLARFSPEGQESVTKKFDENTVMGTADYLAPEQAINLHDVDARADVYSLGATLYALLVGTAPFAEGTVAQKLLWHQMRDPTPVSERRPDVPEEVSRVVAKMMAKDPAQRFQSCAGVIEALAPFCATTPTPQGPARPGAGNGRSTSAAYLRTNRVGPSTTTRQKQAPPAPAPADSAARRRADDSAARRRDEDSARRRRGDDSAARRRRDEDSARRRRERDDRPRRRDADVIAPAGGVSYGVLALIAVMAGVILLVGGVILFLIIGPSPTVSSTSSPEDEDARLAKAASVRQAVVQPAAVQPAAVQPAAVQPAPPQALAEVVGLVFAQEGAHDKGLERVAFAHEGNRVATCGQDGAVKLWDVLQRRLIRTMPGHAGGAYSASFLAMGRLLLTCGADKNARLWDTTTGQQTNVFPHQMTYVRCAVIGRSDNDLITAGEDRYVRLWDVVQRKSIRAMLAHTKEVAALAFRGPRFNQVVSASHDQTLKLWNLDDGKELKTLAGHTGICTSVAVTPDGKLALSGSDDGTVRLWDLDSGLATHIFGGDLGHVRAVAVSPDGRRALSAGDDKKIRLWDLRVHKELFVYEGHTDSVTGLAFSPTGKHFVSCGQDRSFRVWGLPPLPPG